MAKGVASVLSVQQGLRRGGGGRTERRYVDFVIDGTALSTAIFEDCVTSFGWGPLGLQLESLDRLLMRAPPDLPEGRTSLYRCAECGDLGCGAVSLRIERSGEGVIWQEFAFQNNYDGEVDLEPYRRLGPFCFDQAVYFETLRRLKQDIVEGGPC